MMTMITRLSVSVPALPTSTNRFKMMKRCLIMVKMGRIPTFQAMILETKALIGDKTIVRMIATIKDSMPTKTLSHQKQVSEPRATARTKRLKETKIHLRIL